METSSPLAAMQQHLPAWGRPDSMFQGLQSSNAHAHLNNTTAFGPGAFDFRDLSMRAPSRGPDYFAMQPVRGSSPTTSLAADLSQNFHIDMRYINLVPSSRMLLTTPPAAVPNCLRLVAPSSPQTYSIPLMAGVCSRTLEPKQAYLLTNFSWSFDTSSSIVISRADGCG